MAQGQLLRYCASHRYSRDPGVRVERFGANLLTVFNDSAERRTARLTLDGLKASAARELLTETDIAFAKGIAEMTLAGEDVAVLELAVETTKGNIR